jgi:hypothetical protein
LTKLILGSHNTNLVSEELQGIFSNDFGEQDFEAEAERIEKARKMERRDSEINTAVRYCILDLYISQI